MLNVCLIKYQKVKSKSIDLPQPELFHLFAGKKGELLITRSYPLAEVKI